MSFEKNKTQFSQQISNLDQHLDRLTNNLPNSSDAKSIAAISSQVKLYYSSAFNKATHSSTARSIIQSYHQFVFNLQEVKLGKLTAEKALEQIQENTDSRKLGVFFYNLAKVCELLFCAGVAAFCGIAAVTVGLPLSIASPFIGFAVTAGTLTLFVTTFGKGIDCFDEFKSTTPINDEDAREKSLFGFFQPVKAEVAAVPTSPTEEDAFAKATAVTL